MYVDICQQFKKRSFMENSLTKKILFFRDTVDTNQHVHKPKTNPYFQDSMAITVFRAGFFVCAVFSINCVFAETLSRNVPPSLKLQPNEVRQMPAQRYEFQDLEIPENARITVPKGSRTPLHLIVQGDFTLAGTIEYQKASSENRQIEVKVPDGRIINLEYKMAAKGGNGGDGGSAAYANGGRGANGSVEGGGGGAGGRRSTGKVAPYWVNEPGADAIGTRGAMGNFACGAEGGDGGLRMEAGDGGILIIEVYGNFIVGEHAKLLLEGSSGQIGKSPTRTYNSNAGCLAGGGGGGPGGNGGFLVAYVVGKLNQYPFVAAYAGEGGIQQWCVWQCKWY